METTYCEHPLSPFTVLHPNMGRSACHPWVGCEHGARPKRVQIASWDYERCLQRDGGHRECDGVHLARAGRGGAVLCSDGLWGVLDKVRIEKQRYGGRAKKRIYQDVAQALKVVK